MGYLFDPQNWEWVGTDNNLRFLVEAFLVNVEIAVIAMVLALAIGLVLALLSIAGNAFVRRAAKLWVDVFRNLPLIFLILYLALTIPEGVRDFWADNAPGFLPDALGARASSWPVSAAWCSTTRRCWRRSCARGSCRSTAASARRRPRWG